MENVHEDLTPDMGAFDQGQKPQVPVHQWQRKVTDRKTQVVSLEPYELRPYTRSVEDLWHRLCAADVPLPFGKVVTDNIEAFAGPCVKLIYLLSHEPWAYRHLRGNTPAFLEAIDAWADEHVPRERTMDAVTLALVIHNSTHKQDASGAAAPTLADQRAAD